MIFYKDRKKLANAYEKWLDENKSIKDCTMSVVGFLERFLDENKVKEFLES